MTSSSNFLQHIQDSEEHWSKFCKTKTILLSEMIGSFLACRNASHVEEGCVPGQSSPVTKAGGG